MRTQLLLYACIAMYALIACGSEVVVNSRPDGDDDNGNGAGSEGGQGQGGYPCAGSDDDGAFDWQSGPYGDDSGTIQLTGVAVDAVGNVVVAGFLGAPIGSTFGCSDHPARAVYDGYVAKYDANGACVWSLPLVGPTAWDDVLVYGVAVESTGDVIIGGYFTALDIDLDGNADYTATGSTDGFVAKLDAETGAVDWLTQAGGASSAVLALTVDGADNIYAVGRFLGTIAVGGVGAVTSLGADGFALQLAGTSGEVLDGLASMANGDEYYVAVAVDRADHLYVGQQGTQTFAVRAIDTTTWDEMWLVPFGANDAQHLTGLGTLSNGDVVMAGFLDEDFNTGTTDLTVAGYGAVFVARLAAADGGEVWARALGGEEAQEGATIYGGFAVDACDNILVGGFYCGTMDFGATELDSGSTDEQDGFIAKLDRDGEEIWAKSIAGTSGSWETVDGIGTHPTARTVVMGGSFDDTIDLGDGVMSATGLNNLFLGQYQP